MTSLPPQLAVLIKQFVNDRMPHVKVFGGRYKQLTDKAATMLRFDLGNTVVKDSEGSVVIEPIPYGDKETGLADFHALRHTFITNLRSVSGRVAQSLARHKSSKMTDRYTHKDIEQDAKVLEEVLPNYTLPSTAKIRMRKSGTDD